MPLGHESSIYFQRVMASSVLRTTACQGQYAVVISEVTYRLLVKVRRKRSYLQSMNAIVVIML